MSEGWEYSEWHNSRKNIKKSSDHRWPKFEDISTKQISYQYIGELPKGVYRSFNDKGEAIYTDINKKNVDIPLPKGWSSRKSKSIEAIVYTNTKTNNSQYSAPGRSPEGYLLKKNSKDTLFYEVYRSASAGKASETLVNLNILGPKGWTHPEIKSVGATLATVGAVSNLATLTAPVPVAVPAAVAVPASQSIASLGGGAGTAVPSIASLGGGAGTAAQSIASLGGGAGTAAQSVSDLLSIIGIESGGETGLGTAAGAEAGTLTVFVSEESQVENMQTTLNKIRDKGGFPLLETIEQIDAWIGKICKCKDDKVKVQPRRANLSDYLFTLGKEYIDKTGTATKLLKDNAGDLITEQAKAAGFFYSKTFTDYKTGTGLQNYHLIQNTGGGQNDCLILSFLGCISSNFRNAEEDIRHQVASDFRRIILPSLPLFKTKFYDELAKKTRFARYMHYIRDMQSTNFLDDAIIDLLVRQYKINILYFEGIKTGQMDTQVGTHLIIMPPAVNIADFRGNTSAIIIYNINNGHYESVYTINNHRLKIIFTPKEVNDLQTITLDGFPFKNQIIQDDVERIEDGTIIYVKGRGGKQYMVIGAHFKDGSQNVDLYDITDDIEKYKLIVAANPGKKFDPTTLGISYEKQPVREISRSPFVETRRSGSLGGAGSAAAAAGSALEEAENASPTTLAAIKASLNPLPDPGSALDAAENASPTTLAAIKASLNPPGPALDAAENVSPTTLAAIEASLNPPPGPASASASASKRTAAEIYKEMEDLSTEFEKFKDMQGDWGDAAYRIYSFSKEFIANEKAGKGTLNAIEEQIKSTQKYQLTEPYMTQISGGLLRARDLVNEFNAAIDKEQGHAGGSRRHSAKRKKSRKTHTSRKSRHKFRR
jgi:hypothetical protein